MEEAEWLACDDPRKMLVFIRGKASSRRLSCFFLPFNLDFTNYSTDGLEEGIGSDLNTSRQMAK